MINNLHRSSVQDDMGSIMQTNKQAANDHHAFSLISKDQLLHLDNHSFCF